MITNPRGLGGGVNSARTLRVAYWHQGNHIQTLSPVMDSDGHAFSHMHTQNIHQIPDYRCVISASNSKSSMDLRGAAGVARQRS